MKITQQEKDFAPITIVLETKEEAQAMTSMMRFVSQPGSNFPERDKVLAEKIFLYFTSKAKL